MIQSIAFFVLVTAPMAVSAQWTGGNNSGYSNASGAGLPESTIYGIISNTLSWLLSVLGFIAIMAFVISGLQYLTSAGDEGQIDTAKTNMKYSIIGVIVALMGWVVVDAIDTWLYGESGMRF